MPDIDFSSNEYRFLKDIPYLTDNVFYLTLGGSRAYGTNLPESDYDLRGGYIEKPGAMFALEPQREEYCDRDTDTCLYSLKKLVRLLSACNPNVIEMLGTRDEDVVYANSIGWTLRDNSSLFLSKRAYFTFLLCYSAASETSECPCKGFVPSAGEGEAYTEIRFCRHSYFR